MIPSLSTASGGLFLSALLVSSAVAAPACNDKMIKLPMYDSTHGAAFNITVGNPPQTIRLLSDWTWQTLWVDTAHCKGEISVADCIPKGQNFFDDTKSKTFKATQQFAGQTWIGTDYTPGIPFVTWFGQDTVCFESDLGGPKMCADNIEFSLSNLTNPLPVVEDIGGVFGYAPVLNGMNATFYPTTYQFMKKNLMNPIVGWHMCGAIKDKSTCYNEDYLTIMGGTDFAVYNQKAMVFHDLYTDPCVNSGAHLSLTPFRDNYWATRWTGFYIGNDKFSLAAKDSPNYNSSSASPSCDAIDPIAVWDQDKFGGGAPMPISAFNYLVNLTSAKKINDTAYPFNAGTQGLYSVPCAGVDKLPNLNFELSSKQNITLIPNQYIDQGKYMPGTCLLNARVWDRPVDGAQSFFGQTVLGRTYLAFDYTRNMVGVAPLNANLAPAS